ncbi:YceH family protein [Neptuniibacter halophilus]|uniref:YceH family protein n=1 Tax=Neptuniibacter halophilus TaxID=651666 RepID=UPI003D9B0503
MDLTLPQTRVIGALLEKEITTPDQYPLSLNALTQACNQKSNREPVMSLAEADVMTLLDQLRDKRLIREESGFGSRVMKYKHRFCNTEFSDLQLTAQELGIICVLLLRGAQTPGELRSRTNRLCSFNDVSEVEQVLVRLAERALVVRLEREPGKRESRYLHLFSGPVDQAAVIPEEDKPLSRSALEQRVAQLEDELASLKQQLLEMTHSEEQER